MILILILILILTLRSATQEVKERLAHDGLGRLQSHHEMMVRAISKEVGEVVEKHKARSAEWYNEVGSRVSTLNNPVAFCILRYDAQRCLSLFALTSLAGPVYFPLQS